MDYKSSFSLTGEGYHPFLSRSKLENNIRTWFFALSMNGKEQVLSFQSIIVSHFQEYVFCYFYHLKDDTMWLNLGLPLYNGLLLWLRQ